MESNTSVKFKSTMSSLQNSADICRCVCLTAVVQSFTHRWILSLRARWWTSWWFSPVRCPENTKKNTSAENVSTLWCSLMASEASCSDRLQVRPAEMSYWSDSFYQFVFNLVRGQRSEVSCLRAARVTAENTDKKKKRGVKVKQTFRERENPGVCLPADGSALPVCVCVGNNSVISSQRNILGLIFQILQQRDAVLLLLLLLLLLLSRSLFPSYQVNVFNVSVLTSPSFALSVTSL